MFGMAYGICRVAKIGAAPVSHFDEDGAGAIGHDEIDFAVWTQVITRVQLKAAFLQMPTGEILCPLACTPCGHGVTSRASPARN